MRLLRETPAAAVLLSTLLLGSSGAASAAPTSPTDDGHTAGIRTDSAPGGSGRQGSAEKPLLETSPHRTRYFSPNGDRRLDKARLEFRLGRSARVKVTVRDDDGTVSGPVRLGQLPPGRHVWKWDGRTDDGAIAPDREYRVDLKAVTGTRKQTASTYAMVDTVRPSGRLISSRPTVYPKATVVDDHVQLVWVVEGWNPWDEEFFPEDDQPAKVRIEIRTRRGEVVWRRSDRNRYTPSFDWYAKRDGRALQAGRYTARVTVADKAGNRRRASNDLRVSRARLVEQTWTSTVPAGRAGLYTPYFGGCNGCPETCSPVASERFADGLSFRPCPPTSGWHTAGYYASDVPFPEAPVDSYRITAAGGPTTPGGADQGQLSGVPTASGDGSTTTEWRPVNLAGHPFLPDQDRPVTWTFTTHRPNSYDVATFTVEYRHYLPAG